MTNLDKARWISLLVPAGLLGGAYVSQYGFGLFPCEMCWWQRYPHFAAIGLALISFGFRGARWPVALAALAVFASGLIGAFHAGVEYGWWEGFTRCTSMVQTGGDPLAAVLAAPITRCDEIQWSLLGISLAGFNFLISTAGALAALVLLGRRK
ncbi:disulfide bond formation protein B [Novosphingobium aquae]|jgi:disulfide bond formation protein DsbB|uniref:Disulfide bond formation protein B n=1 Tax=Novosphingobium aquae TaxID=3133435 RepID=A0ABU8S8N5_9SPHN